MTDPQKQWLCAYSGTNYFVQSLKSQYLRKNQLSDRQVAALEKVISQTKEPKQPEEETTVTTTTKKKPVQELMPETDLFSLETLVEEGEEMQQGNNETPILNNIEEQLNRLAGQVVAQTMEKANKQIAVLQAKMNQIVAGRAVMHVKVGDTVIQKLTHEAHALLPKLITVTKLGENILLKGPAGCGKSTLGEQLAEALAQPFGHLCFSAGVSETWLFGRQLPTGFVEGEFSKFYRNGGVFLLDELDAADANLLMAINTAIAGDKMYNPILGEIIDKHKNFHCIAAANTFGLGGDAQYTGRNRLDAATLDRFTTFAVTYNEKLEAKLCPDADLLSKLHKARKELDKRNAKQIISTRAVARLYKLVASGFSTQDALTTLVVSWPKGLADEIGLCEETSPF